MKQLLKIIELTSTVPSSVLVVVSAELRIFMILRGENCNDRKYESLSIWKLALGRLAYVLTTSLWDCGHYS